MVGKNQITSDNIEPIDRIRNRVVYVKFIFSKGEMLGVFNKIHPMARAFNKCNIDYVVFNREFDGVVDNVEFINVDKYWPKGMALLNRFFRYVPFYSWLKRNRKRYSLICMRYPLFDFSSFFIRPEVWKRIIPEYHSKIYEEIPKLKINRILRLVQYYSERFFSNVNLKYTPAIVAVTQDILDYQVSLNKSYEKLGFVFSNGVDINQFEFKYDSLGLEIDRHEIHFVFMASRFCDWHGLDRLINSISEYSLKTALVVHIVGVTDGIPDEINHENIEVIFHGALSQGEVRDLLVKCDVAFDSLALDRINFTESSTLKAKEYLAVGIPIVGIVPDVDVINLGNDFKGFHQIRVIDEKFDLDEVVNWYLTLIEKPYFVGMMRKARNLVSWDLKARSLKAFFDKVMFS